MKIVIEEATWEEMNALLVLFQDFPAYRMGHIIMFYALTTAAKMFCFSEPGPGDMWATMMKTGEVPRRTIQS